MDGGGSNDIECAIVSLRSCIRGCGDGSWKEHLYNADGGVDGLYR